MMNHLKVLGKSWVAFCGTWQEAPGSKGMGLSVPWRFVAGQLYGGLPSKDLELVQFEQRLTNDALSSS